MCSQAVVAFAVGALVGAWIALSWALAALRACADELAGEALG